MLRNTMSKTAIILMVILLAVGVTLAACGPSEPEPTTKPTTKPTSSPAPEAEKVYTLTMQSIGAEGTLMYTSFQDNLLTPIEIASNGRIKFEHTGAGTIVPDFELFTAVQQGIVDVAYVQSFYWQGTMPLAVLQYGFPGQYTAKWDVQETLWSGMLDIYRDAYAEVNLHFVTEFLENPLDLCSSKKFDGLASLKGAKIRAGGAYGDMLKELAGASVVMMPGGDIYTSMATGVIDGFVFGDILTAKIFGLLETCQYAVSPTLYGGHGGGCFFVNMDTWNELPEDVKLLIDLGVNNYAKDFTLYFQPGWQVKQEFVNDMGGELVPFPAADIAKINEWTFKKMDELAAQDPKFTAPAVELMKSIMANR